MHARNMLSFLHPRVVPFPIGDGLWAQSAPAPSPATAMTLLGRAQGAAEAGHGLGASGQPTAVWSPAASRCIRAAADRAACRARSWGSSRPRAATAGWQPRARSRP